MSKIKKTITAKDLKEALKSVPDDAVLVVNDGDRFAEVKPYLAKVRKCTFGKSHYYLDEHMFNEFLEPDKIEPATLLVIDYDFSNGWKRLV